MKLVYNKMKLGKWVIHPDDGAEVSIDLRQKENEVAIRSDQKKHH